VSRASAFAGAHVSGAAGESLRRAALDALGPHGSDLARDALVHGTLDVTTGVTRWEASKGRVEGHRVALGLDAGRLARLREAPAAYDAICAAVAAAVALRPGESLFELELHAAAQGLAETPYRGRRPRP
jgi:hypothetical protein